MKAQESTMSKRASLPCTTSNKKPKLQTDLLDVSSKMAGCYTVTDCVKLHAINWRSCCYKGCIQCSRKVDKICTRHPNSPLKYLYCLRVLLKQDNAELWVTAFDDIATAIIGMSADQYNYIDEASQSNVVDSVVGLKMLVNIVKSIRSGYTNYVINQISPARTAFPDDIIDSC